MTTRDMKIIFDRVLTWPRERQRNVIEAIQSIKEQEVSLLRLSDAQIEEVRKRLREKKPKTMTLATFKKREAN